MSSTRDLMAGLRRRMGEDRPLSAPRPLTSPAQVPVRRYSPEGGSSSFAREASRHTTAVLGIGHVGGRYATDVVLQFQAELAVAHQAVAAELPEGWAEEHGYLPLKSLVSAHREFLLRPELGRRLDQPSLELLRATAEKNVDVQLILADGLSASACMASGPALLAMLGDTCRARGWKVGTPCCVRYARVWLEDELGQEVGARVAVIVLGERPGLGTGDGLSAYLVHGPEVGKTDGDRNMLSNLHARGTPVEVAVPRLCALIAAMLEQGTSGVGLDLSRLPAELGAVEDRSYRPPQRRQRLVEQEEP